MRLAALVIALGAITGVAACSDASHGAPADTASDGTDPCRVCRADQLCVASYDGTCSRRDVGCVARTVDCPGNACTPACETAYCTTPFRCTVRSPCGGEPPEAFTCYGP